MAIVVRRQIRAWRIGGWRVVAMRARMRTSRVIGWLESLAVRMMRTATQHKVQVDGQRGDDGDDGTHRRSEGRYSIFHYVEHPVNANLDWMTDPSTTLLA